MKILLSEEDLKYVEECLMNGEVVKEDLRRWFKEKWVDVSKKVKGKHPPCGRKEAKDSGYPKCRPSKKVSKETPKTASSYDKKEKKSMVAQKRRAEKTHNKSGTGNPPKMARYDESHQIISLVLEEIKNIDIPPKLININENFDILSDGMKYHLINEKPLTENVYRVYSEKFFQLFNEARNLYENGIIELYGNDLELIQTNIGETGIYEGNEVYLDIPFVDEDENHLVEAKHRGKNVNLNRPFRTPGGPKKFAVYVKGKGGNIKKVTFGDPNLKIKNSNPKRAKSFRARHKCSQKKDRTTAGYWACSVGRYSKNLGLKSKRSW